jgi:hypothetical protein
MNTFSEGEAFDPGMCDHIIEVAGLVPARPQTSEHGGEQNVHDYALRSCTAHFLDRRRHPQIVVAVQEFVNMHNIWGFNIGGGGVGMPSIEVLKYVEGDHQARHTDWGGSNSNRKLSVSIQLSDPSGYEGGDLHLHDGPGTWQCNREKGSGTVFPSWMLHGVEPVTSGERWVLVAWNLGPPWT